MFENKKDKISSQGKVLTKVMRDAGNRNGGCHTPIPGPTKLADPADPN